MREMEEKMEGQKKLIEEMKRKAEQGSMQTQGEVQELLLEELLRNSFPSGHASSATFAVFVLAGFAGWPVSWIFVTVAVLVALSRVVVRIHHLSDILGGAVVGAALGAVAASLAGPVLGL